MSCVGGGGHCESGGHCTSGMAGATVQVAWKGPLYKWHGGAAVKVAATVQVAWRGRCESGGHCTSGMEGPLGGAATVQVLLRHSPPSTLPPNRAGAAADCAARQAASMPGRGFDVFFFG